ncbi:hypothetical protein [Winogradskya humida]|uniref:Dolichyl-phosphate-mannose-protein mannosyltransferase n=1 Tax=Winogradskya humida TaxID=113566 RepID=A0ABQ3ZKZ6_9ACTN|nr:hypothetical protein [Actinoplanes humidus]GIE19197.1 hypothetical protein Ahu01nite_022990 [Actinoplanes humidus]
MPNQTVGDDVLETPALTPDRDPVPLWLHRGLTLCAVMALVVGTRTFWNVQALPRPGLALVLTGGYIVMLIAAILALCVSTGRALARVDVLVLGTAIVIKLIGAWPSITGEKTIGVDEGILMDYATRTLAEGHNPYLATWPDLAVALPTQLMNGDGVFDFAYPPFGVEVSALLQRVFPSGVAVVVLAWFALIVTAIMLFRMAPVPLRPVATVGVLGLGTLTSYANNAYPSLIALPLLCLAVWKWTATGRGGRLGRDGLLRAVALGLACSTHQLGWFLALFLVTGIAVLRLGDLPLRRAAGVVLRYGLVALGAFVLTSAPFLVLSPHAWLTGVFEPLLQHAVPHGQGIMGISYYLIGGSGALDFYGTASHVLLVAMLITYALNLRTVGPAAVVLPWLVFMVSTRSQDGYWVLTMPLWIVALLTTGRDDFADAYRFNFRLPARAARAATVALFLPTVACLAIAIATPQPLDMTVTTPVTRGQAFKTLTVEVENRSSRAVAPAFAVTTDIDISEYWKISAGPETLAPHATAAYTLTPNTTTWKPPVKGIAILRAVSDRPQTLSSQYLLR